MTDLDLFKEITGYSKKIKEEHQRRDEQAQRMERMYLLAWDEEDQVSKSVGQGVKITKSPDPHNQIKGVVDLLGITEPEVRIPRNKNDQTAVAVSARLEKLGRAMLRKAGQVNKKQIHREVLLSMALYDEAVIGIDDPTDLVKYRQQIADDNQNDQRAKSLLAQAQQLALTTPYLLNIMNPRATYPVRGATGLTSVYRTYKKTIGEVIDEFPAAKSVLAQLKVDTMKDRRRLVDFHDFWDDYYRCVWLDQMALPIMLEPHELPFIPFAHAIGQGSALFTDPADQRTPFLMAEDRSQLWARMNLMYTAVFTNLFRWGITPTYTFVRGEATNRAPQIKDFGGGLLNYFDVPAGAQWAATQQGGAVNSDVMSLMQVAERKGQESTITQAALGGQVGGGNQPYSTVALWASLGKQVVEDLRRQTGEVMGETVYKMLMWTKHKKTVGSVTDNGYTIPIRPEEIPDNLVVEVELEAALPQDRANLLTVMNQGRTFFPDRYLIEDVWGEGDAEELQRERMKQQATEAYFMRHVQRMMQLREQAEQMAQANQAAAMQGPGGPGGPMPGQGGPPPGAQVPGQMQPGMMAGAPGMGMTGAQMTAGTQGPMQPPPPQIPGGEV